MRDLIKEGIAAFRRGRRFVTRDIWHIGRPGETVPHGLIIKNIRVLILLVQGVTEETLLLRAAALTFASMLFLVPFLVFMFYFIQTFNLGDQVYLRMSDEIDARLSNVVSSVSGIVGADKEPSGEEEAGETEAEADAIEAPEGEPEPRAAEGEMVEAAPAGDQQTLNDRNELLQNQLLSFVFPMLTGDSSLSDDTLGQNPVQLLAGLAEKGATNPQALTITGLLFIVSTVFGFMRNVESAFNGIWGVRRTRNIFRAFSDYMMITLFVPFIAAAALGVTAALESEHIASLLGPLAATLRMIQVLAICLVFSLLYYFVPNTKVRYRNALLGGIVAGIMWSLCSWGYIKFQVGLARYALFFSGFALFPLLLMWIYTSWIILLFGALLSFAYQNEKTFAMERLAESASFAYREALAVRTAVELARRFQNGLPALSVSEAARAWNVPTRLLNETFDCLVKAGLVAACATEPPTYQPARSPGGTRVQDVLSAVRDEGREPSQLREEERYRPLYEGLEAGDTEWRQSNVAELASRYAPDVPRPPEADDEVSPDS